MKKKRMKNIKIYGKRKYTYLNYKEELLCLCFLLLEQEKNCKGQTDEKEWLCKKKSKPTQPKMVNTHLPFPTIFCCPLHPAQVGYIYGNFA